MEPRIEFIPEKKLIGQRLSMTLANNNTRTLWQRFMPRQKEIRNNISTELISMQVYDQAFDYETFTPEVLFEKWATMEVTDFDNVPEGMETFILPAGAYAVFHYKGAPGAFAPTFHYIFGTWLPASGYVIDKRPHFEVLGEKYRNDSPDSEEEIWIPVRLK